MAGSNTTTGLTLQDAAQARENAREQARQAQRDAENARNEAREAARDAQRDAQQEIQQAKRELEQALKEAGLSGGGVGRPGVPVQFPPFPGGPQIPDGVVVMSVAFFVMCAVIAIGLPIARAFSRRMDRRNVVPPASDADTRARLERIEHAVDAIAVEVERISEGQRFTTKVLGEFRALPQPDPSVAVPDRGAVPISRAREAR